MLHHTNSTKVLIMWLAGKMRHIPCSHWLTDEARWGGALCDETKTAACDTSRCDKIDKIKLVLIIQIFRLNLRCSVNCCVHLSLYFLF